MGYTKWGMRKTLRAAKDLGLSLEFEGQGEAEVGRVTDIQGDDAPAVSVGDVIVRIDPNYFRPAEVESLLGDASKARLELGWEPKFSARDVCSEMVQADLQDAKKRSLLNEKGFETPMPAETRRFEDFRYLEKSKFVEDFDLWQRMLLEGVKIGSIPRTLYSYRLHGNQISTQDEKPQFDRAQGVRKRHKSWIDTYSQDLFEALELACRDVGFLVTPDDRAYFWRVLKKCGLLETRDAIHLLSRPVHLSRAIRQSIEKRLRKARYSRQTAYFP